ncbi:MAG: hypothetical protein WA485_17400 [Candidatus Sulfotelmatobacter sp.]
MTNDKSNASYAIIRHNVRTYQSAGVVLVVKGKENAESELGNLESAQPSDDRHEGWRYFIEKTSMKAGLDPAEATHQRQAELDLRESKALEDDKTAVPRSENAPR